MTNIKNINNKYNIINKSIDNIFMANSDTNLENRIKCLDYESYNCQNCGYSGTILELEYTRSLKTYFKYTCSMCLHDNTLYMNSNKKNNDVNCPKKWK